MMGIFRLPQTIIRNRLHLPTSPSFCTFMMTWRCNARCQMCDIWQKEAGEEMNVQQIEDILRQLKPMDAIRLTGGEPFLRNDLAAITNMADHHLSPRIIHLTSNGLLGERIEAFVKDITCHRKIHLKITLLGAGEKHDKMTGVHGAFEKAMGTLARLSRIREDYGFYLAANLTITDSESARDYRKLKARCTGMGLHLYPVIAYENPPLYMKGHQIHMPPQSSVQLDLFCKMKSETLGEILNDMVLDVQAMDNFIERTVKKYYLLGLKNRLTRNRNWPAPRCTALRSHLRILPNGDIPVCLFNSKIVGNLTRQKFEDIWFGDGIRSYREAISRCPGCWAQCETIPNAIYTGDVVKALLWRLLVKRDSFVHLNKKGRADFQNCRET